MCRLLMKPIHVACSGLNRQEYQNEVDNFTSAPRLAWWLSCIQEHFCGSALISIPWEHLPTMPIQEGFEVLKSFLATERWLSNFGPTHVLNSSSSKISHHWPCWGFLEVRSKLFEEPKVKDSPEEEKKEAVVSKNPNFLNRFGPAILIMVHSQS